MTKRNDETIIRTMLKFNKIFLLQLSYKNSGNKFNAMAHFFSFKKKRSEIKVSIMHLWEKIEKNNNKICHYDNALAQKLLCLLLLAFFLRKIITLIH